MVFLILECPVIYLDSNGSVEISSLLPQLTFSSSENHSYIKTVGCSMETIFILGRLGLGGCALSNSYCF